MSTDAYIWIAILVLAAWFAYSRFAGVKNLKNLSADEFQTELQDSRNSKVLIDVREPAEVKQGKIPGAMNIPLSQIKNRTSEIPADKSVFLYCRSGMRSKQAARILMKSGFKDITNLQGGIVSWRGKVTK